MSLSHGWIWTEAATEQVFTWDSDIGRKARERFPDLTRFPSKAELREAGPGGLLKGWLPPQPLILPGSRVLALGSCFAGHLIEWLVANGYDHNDGGALVSLVRNPFENVAVIAQQLRWAFGEVDPASLFWVGKDKKAILATEEKRLAMRDALLQADVFIATLSMAELWYHQPSGEPLWRLMLPHVCDLDQFAFRVMSVAQIVAELEAIERIRAQWLPKVRIIYTVSPLPMATTFRPVSPITANTASKAAVRAALDEFLRARGDDLNRIYFYFPSYELVNALPSDPFLSDNRHLQDSVIDMVLDFFARTYTQAGREASQAGVPLDWPKASAESAYIAQLEARNAELQKTCDERLQVIEGLKRACDERLALIEQLHRAAERATQAREVGAPAAK